jgi:Na+/H+ antiporter NhaD/arsenite permease-like protein
MQIAAGVDMMVLAAQSAGPPRPVLPMVVIGLILVSTFVVIAFEVYHKSLASMLGAIAAVVAAMELGVFGGEHPYAHVYKFIAENLDVIGVIVGTSILVEISASTGLFHFLAIRIVKLTGGRSHLLLPAVLAATVGFVTFLTIAPAVLIMTSLVLVITRALDDPPTPYIMAVAIGANSGALVTFASGIPTLMIGTSAHIPYMQFFVVSTPLAVLSALTAYGVIRAAYGRQLRAAGAAADAMGDAAARRQRVAGFDEWSLVTNRALFYRSAIILALTIVGFALAQRLRVGLDFIAFCGATAAILFSGFDVEEAIRKVRWPIILFFVGLFVLVGTVRQTGLLDLLAEQILAASGSSVTGALLILVPFVFLAAGVVDNIPVAATMIPIVRGMIAAGLPAAPLWWSLIAACNLGGNPTPVGSIAAVIALQGLEKERGVRIGWGEYLKVGGTITLLQIPLVIGYMLLYYALGIFPAL